MVYGSFRGIASKLFCIGVVWIIFLFIVHLILDFEQRRKYFKPAASKLQRHSIFSLDDLDFAEGLCFCLFSVNFLLSNIIVF